MKVLPSEECIIQYKQLLKIENKRHQVKVCTLEKDTENIWSFKKYFGSSPWVRL